MELRLITSKRHDDHRGFFSETYNRKTFSDLNIDIEFVQDNHSLSTSVGTLRGLHYQAPPHAQAKLVRCIRGAVFDVVVDIRVGSPDYGVWKGFDLTAELGNQLFIPVGYAHGFITTEPNSEIIYKCSDYYAPETECSILWNDADICIDWPLYGKPIISNKDQIAPSFKNIQSPFLYDGDV